MAKKGLIELAVWQRIILVINESNDETITTISRKTDVTFSHTSNVLDSLFTKEIIYFYKEGRIKQVHLTDKGKFIQKNIKNIYDCMKEEEENVMERN